MAARNGYARESTAAFDELIGALGEVRDAYVLSPERFRDELEVVEAFRYVTHLLSEASELLVEADPERPRFSSIVTPSRKFLGDNPDAIYHQAVIRGDRAYRVTGSRDTQSYISFTIHGPDPAGGINGPVLADVNDRDLHLDADGRYELILSPDEKPPGSGRDWVQLDPAARFVIVRHYFRRERSAQTDPDIAVRIHIEPLVDPGPPPPLDDRTLAARLRDATEFLRATTTRLRVFGTPSPMPVAFVSTEPNSVGVPTSFRATGIAAAGGVDIYYSSGTFDLGPDDALVMEGRLPESVFTNVMLWNVHMQTLEYVHRRSSLNAAQMVLGPDRSYRIVISEKDPGVPNWIDTGGHRRGTIFWRFLLPESQPEQPRCSVVPVGSL